MHEPANWKFAIEVHPPDWRFPAGKTWLAGWLRPAAGGTITDVRVRLHHRVILGLFGLPHPAFPRPSAGPTSASGPGFSFLLAPQRGATLLQLEARDLSGRWREFFRTRISAAPDAPVATLLPELSRSLKGLVTALLKRRMRQSRRTWTELADDLVAAFVSEPLDSYPNAPFIGALEEPHAIGRLHHGRVPVTGWLAHPKARITRLSVVIDPLPASTLPHGPPRTDILGAFPLLDSQTNAAFAGEVALPADLAPPVLLKIHAELDNGERHLAFARRFTPQVPDSVDDMPPSVQGFTFARAVWALYRAAGRYALPHHGLIRAARTIWANYQALPAFRSKKHFPSDHVSFQTRSGAHDRKAAGRPDSTGNTPDSDANDRPNQMAIAPADGMWVADSAHYFESGREALEQVRQAVALVGTKRINAILDLPCGHGRVARWLRTAYPKAHLTVSDTEEPAVAFCVAEMTATGVLAAVDGRHWPALPGPYEIIWCGSLLTHFDRDQWINHLRRFAERLAPDGVLVFTSHGVHALDRLQSGEKDYGLPPAGTAHLRAAVVTEGFGFAGYPDSPAYGISIAQPGWIRELIAAETDLQVLDLRVAAWDQHQDVVVCTRRTQRRRGWWRKFSSSRS